MYSEALLRHESEIAKLPALAGAERKAAADRVNRQAEVLAAETKATSVFSELGLPANMESIPALHIVAESRRKAEELDSQFSALNANRKNAARDIAKLRRELETNGELLAALAEPKPIAVLQQALKSTEPIAAVALEYVSRRKAAEDDERKLAAAIRELPWAGTADALANADLPSAALVEDWRQRMSLADSRIEAARAQLEESEEQVRQCEAAIRQQQAGRTIPTFEAMETARRHRDLGWQSVRKSWLEGVIENGLAPNVLADAYETRVKAADNAADDLREHANDAARLVQAQAELANAALRRDARAVALLALRSEKIRRAHV